MTIPQHEVYAIRYGHHLRTANHNFIQTQGDPLRPMPMDYFIWLIRCADGRHVLVDTGFTEASAVRRGRVMLRTPEKGLAAMGAPPDSIADVVITHLHYDHAGNVVSFPAAKFWLQEREMQFSTGKYMCHDFFRLAYEPEDVSAIVSRHFESRLQLIDGDYELEPGITLHWVGGHTAGLQVVRVFTPSGWLVLASDLLHYDANLDLHSPFPIVFRPDQTFDGYARIRGMVSDRRMIVPGHDPAVMQRYARDPSDPDFTVQLWRPL